MIINSEISINSEFTDEDSQGKRRIGYHNFLIQKSTLLEKIF